MKYSISFVLFMAALACGAVYSPTVGHRDTIQYYINNRLSVGDTLNIPAGTWTWKVKTNEPAIYTNFAFNLIGSGHTTCTIIGDTASVWNESLLSAENKSNNIMRVCGIHFTRCRMTSGNAIIEIGTKNYRVDHCLFDECDESRGINAIGEGLIDSCYFYNSSQGVSVYGVVAATDTYEGDSLWSANGYDSLGTSHAVFVEDCKFYYNDLNDGSLDCYNGKFVFRYNHVENTNIGWHGFDTGPRRSAIGYEIYSNTFNWKLGGNLFCVVNNRGGTGVIYNNTSAGIISTFCLLQNYRSHQNGPDGQKCDGSSAVDENTPGQSGWLCRDQVGAGINRARKPLYVWGNTMNGNPANAIVEKGSCLGGICDTTHIKLNRDYYNSEKSSYTAYTYPHPLRGGSGVSSRTFKINLTTTTPLRVVVSGKRIMVDFTIAQSGKAALSLYTLQGSLVKPILSGYHRQGAHHRTFSPNCSPGIYFVRLSTPKGSQVAPLLLR